MKVLGYILSDDGSTEASWTHMKQGAWEVWWVNLGRGRCRTGIEKAIALLNRVALPILLLQCLLWPWSRSHASRVDAFQAQLVARLVKLPGKDKPQC